MRTHNSAFLLHCLLLCIRVCTMYMVYFLYNVYRSVYRKPNYLSNKQVGRLHSANLIAISLIAIMRHCWDIAALSLRVIFHRCRKEHEK